jgi:predicted TIM-barrel fold metal-dependent hydrolase
MDERYVVISADGHAGASMDAYRDYLDPAFRDEYARWLAAFENPYEDLTETESRDYQRNFDNAIRQRDLEADGIVGEVVFPNTIPPFYAGHPLFNAPDPTSSRELEQRWAGLHAHNRWLSDWCAELPGRRAGVAQILLDDVDRALEEVSWVRKQPGLFGGILLPNPSPDTTVAPLHAPVYERLWSLLEDLELPVNVHGGQGGPNLGDHPSTPMMRFLEFGWYSQRPLVRLIFSGVLERHPRLKLVFTEVGSSWVPSALAELDRYYELVVSAPIGSVEARYGEFVRDQVPLRPSEYWSRQCYLGASSMSPGDWPAARVAGIQHVMWGGDYPHLEGTHPYTSQSLRFTFAGVPHDEVRLLLGANAAAVYGFDVGDLTPIAARIGPKVADVDRPLGPDEVPADAVTMALRGMPG